MTSTAIPEDEARQLKQAERLAVIVDPALSLGSLANTVAAIAVGLGARARHLGGTPLRDGYDRTVHASAEVPVPILQGNPEALRALLLRALPLPPEATLVVFPQFARAIHRFSDYHALFPQKDLASEALDGVGLAGPEKWVRSLTGSLKLLR